MDVDVFTAIVLHKRNGGPQIKEENEPLWTIGLVEEAGEVAGVVKKELYHGHSRNHEKFLNECGDVLFYLTCLLYDRGFTLNHAMDANAKKIQERYPNGFNNEASINRKA
jgi:NTP pyrophosphatase (non-canonical NTP hydrolase)